jgi:hypothetical protein
MADFKGPFVREKFVKYTQELFQVGSEKFHKNQRSLFKACRPFPYVYLTNFSHDNVPLNKNEEWRFMNINWRLCSF